MFEPLNGPSKHYTISVDNVTAKEVVIPLGTTQLERKVVTMQSEDGKFRVFFAQDGVVPSSAQVTSDGFIQFKRQLRSYEATESQKMYVIAIIGTVNIHIAERA